MTITNELLDFMDQGGYAFMIPLLAMSVLSLSVILERLFALRNKKIVPAGFEDILREMIRSEVDRDLRAQLRGDDTLIGSIFVKALDDYGNGENDISLEKCLEVNANHYLEYLSRRLWILNAIGNLAPLLGLLGTVAGLAMAFERIGAVGLSKESVASGISMALITTITGLTIALPTLFALYGLQARSERHHREIKKILSHFLLWSKS